MQLRSCDEHAQRSHRPLQFNHHSRLCRGRYRTGIIRFTRPSSGLSRIFSPKIHRFMENSVRLGLLRRAAPDSRLCSTPLRPSPGGSSSGASPSCYRLHSSSLSSSDVTSPLGPAANQQFDRHFRVRQQFPKPVDHEPLIVSSRNAGLFTNSTIVGGATCRLRRVINLRLPAAGRARMLLLQNLPHHAVQLPRRHPRRWPA